MQRAWAAACLWLRLLALGTSDLQQRVAKLCATGLALPNKEAAKQVKKVLKEAAATHQRTRALTYLAKRAAVWGWEEEEVRTLIDRLSNIRQSLVPVKARVALLRWLARLEMDQARMARREGHMRSRVCVHCSQADSPHLAYPGGTRAEAYCVHHCRVTWHRYADADVLRGLHMPPPPDWEPMPSARCLHEACGLCGTGQASVEHWMRFCPVVGAAAARVGTHDI